MANGELMATEIGSRFLKSQGIDVTWMDARDMLSAEDRGASAKASVLSATCSFAPDAALEQRLDASTPVVITQGFIARDSEGNTCLLGRGGSDTSAAYLGAKIRAKQIEIWTDVPGMFSANPRSTPTARLIRALHYDEAQEIATSGAKVLHPRCLLPARQYQIPLYVYATQTPDLEGTLITGESGAAAQVKAVCNRKGITLISLDSPGMWHQVGFMADAFAVFKEHGMSVDLVSTSETNVTVSLDPAANTLDGELLGKLQTRPVEALRRAGHRTLRLGVAGRAQHPRHPAQARRCVRVVRGAEGLPGQPGRQRPELHVRGRREPGRPAGRAAARPADPPACRATPSWARPGSSCSPSPRLSPRARSRGGPRSARHCWVRWRSATAPMSTISRRSDAARAGARRHQVHRPRVVRAQGQSAPGHPAHGSRPRDSGSIACRWPRSSTCSRPCPGISPERILFTPNFAPRAEYERALALGVHVTIDNLFVLQHWLDAFKGKSVFLRIDTGIGRGHHHHVKTAGAQSKFGIPAEELDEVARLAKAGGVTINGLHAHAGSGVFDVDNWTQVGSVLVGLVKRFPDVKFIDVGGGLGVPDRVEGRELDLARLDAALAKVASAIPGVTLWLEPGRYLVANAGVLLARVTQTKIKSGIRYVGVATGMNSLIRPALYGAHHDIVNLTPLWRAGEHLGECRGSDLRELGLPRARPAAAGMPVGRCAADRDRGRLRPRDVVELQPARAGGRAAAQVVSRASVPPCRACSSFDWMRDMRCCASCRSRSRFSMASSFSS